MNVRRVVAHYLAEVQYDSRHPAFADDVAARLRQELADKGCDAFGPTLTSEYGVQVEGYVTEDTK